MNAQEKFSYAHKKLSAFNNYIEVADFRHFLLLALNMEGEWPQELLKQFGFGSKDKSVLPFDIEKKAFFTKSMQGLSSSNQMVIYNKPGLEKEIAFINKASSNLFKDVLNSYEKENLLSKKFVMLTPKVYDFSRIGPNADHKTESPVAIVEFLFDNLAELIVSQDLKYVFLLEGEGEEPDIVFSLNISTEGVKEAQKTLQMFDVFIDEERKLRGHTFIRMKNGELTDEEMKMEFLNEIKDYSHSELYNSHFTIIVSVKSFAEL
jgi:hypothetical protein